MAPTHKCGSGDSRKSPITIDIDSRENSPPLANVQSSSTYSGATQVLGVSPDAQPSARRRDPNFSPHVPRHVEASGKWIIPRRPPPRPKPRTRAMRPASRPCKYPCDSCVKAGTTCYAFRVLEGCDRCQYGKQGQQSRVPLHLRCSAISRALMARAAEDAAEVAWVKCPATYVHTAGVLGDAPAEAFGLYLVVDGTLTRPPPTPASSSAVCTTCLLPTLPTLVPPASSPPSMSHHIRVKPTTVDAYLSAVCNQLGRVFPNVRDVRKSRIVARTLVGCKKLYSLEERRKRALTQTGFRALHPADSSSISHDDMLFWAILLTGFHMLKRLALSRLQCHGELLLRADGTVPMQCCFMRRLRHQFLPYDVAANSLRSGGATFMAEASVPLHLIQKTGR
ncbi:hypothetical protein FB107DRAFT_252564 [Schizophyllum commune]